MPDLSNLIHAPPSPSSLPQPSPVHLQILQPCISNGTSSHLDISEGEPNGLSCRWNGRLRLPISAQVVTGVQNCNISGVAVIKKDRKGRKKAMNGKTLADHVRVWVEKKVESGIPEREYYLPFLHNAPRMAECRLCCKYIYPGEELLCSIEGCQEAFHATCTKQKNGLLHSRSFKCPQHVCFICKQRACWRCIRCMRAAHTKCAPWPEYVIYPTSKPRGAVCWRHPADWRLEKEHAVPTGDIEEAICRLPLPYINQEFKIDSILKDVMENKKEPAPYVHIRRNIYLVKRRRDDLDVCIGCTSCSPSSTCGEKCECRGLLISCSRVCHCSDMCLNRPFRKEKRIKVVKTQFCGWGVVALESINKGDFVIEYIGEVIDDALCEQRLWDMKYRGDHNFYMCEIRKDFTIDATFKGNASRFLNHGCDPNCKLEKWQVEGETRVGVFACRSIEAGESLTYDYRFVHFGPMVKCSCRASNCRGYLGSKKKINKVNLCWGCKRRRTTNNCNQGIMIN